MIEIQIWAEKYDETIFELTKFLAFILILIKISYFCEHNVFESLFKIMVSTTFSEITVQIIQSFGMLLSNLQKPTNICKILHIIIFFLNYLKKDYLLSTKIITQTLLWKFDFQNEEIVEYYINFLKGLALKVHNGPIQFFFNEVFTQFLFYVF